MPNRRRALAALAMCLSLLTAACGGGGGGGSGGDEANEGGGGTVRIGGQSIENHGTKDVSGEDEVELEADDFYFEPTVLSGSAGERIEVKISNESNTEHNFSIDSLGIDEDIEGGEDDVEVSVTLPQSGTLVFYCKYHKAGGMLGEFRAA